MSQKQGLIKIKNSAMRELVEFARSLGYSVERSKSGHIKFMQAGISPIFTSSTPSDCRSWMNCKARLKRQVSHVAA